MRVNVMKNLDVDDTVMSDTIPVQTDNTLKLEGYLNSVQKQTCKTSDEETAKQCLSFVAKDEQVLVPEVKKDQAQEKQVKYFDKAYHFHTPLAGLIPSALM